MSPAALLAAGLLCPAPAAAAAAVYAPAGPAALLEEVSEPSPWWDLLRPDPPDPPAAFEVDLLAPALGESAAVRLLGAASAGGAGAWVTETSLLSKALRSRGQIRADYWTDFDDTRRVGGQVVATTWARNLCVDAEANRWTQSRDPFPGDRLGGEWYTGDVNAVFRVADHPRGRLRTGGGAAWLVRDDGEVEAGYNGTVACDFGLLSHAVAGFEVDYGRIGGDELFRWRVGGGWAFKLFQLRAGYDDYRLGDEDRAGCYAGVVLRY